LARFFKLFGAFFEFIVEFFFVISYYVVGPVQLFSVQEKLLFEMTGFTDGNTGKNQESGPYHDMQIKIHSAVNDRIKAG